MLAHCAFELNHLDLVMAVRETGEYMIELGNEDPEHNRHMRSIGRRYIDNDIYAWTRGILGFDPGYPWDGSMLGCRTPHILEKPRPPEGTSKREWGSVLERRESGETPAEFIIRLDPVPRADRLAFPDHR